MLLLSAALGVAASGCAGERRGDRRPEPVPVATIVVAPVLNLSNTSEIELLKITDIVAAELQSTGRVAVVPANLARAALIRLGKTRVESPADATVLAREFGADATLVTALTEYDPYHPPRVGLVMQLYRTDRTPSGVRLAGDSPNWTAPMLQVQRVYSAADDDVMDQVRSYAREREGHDSPYEWRKFVRSQELFVRYCCWASIRSILRQGGLSGAAEAEGAGR